MNSHVFIFFNNEIFKLYKDKNNITRLTKKDPTEETTNQTCFLLHHNKEIKKSGYFIFDKDKILDEDLILAQATKKLNLIDSTMVHLIKIEIDDHIIYYYIAKIEIERLFIEYEFNKIYPFELIFYQTDIYRELYGLISEDIFFMKQINSYKDLETNNKIFYQTDILSFQDNLSYLFNRKAKKIIYNGSYEELINIHDKLNINEMPNYISYNNRTLEEKKEIIDPVPFINNLELFNYDELLKIIKENRFKNFCFQDKFSIYYKAKKIKPIMWILSFVFLLASLFYSYQFINTQTINYIYTNKINKLNTDIRKYNKENKNALKKQYLQYYKPLNINLLNNVMSIFNKLDIASITHYSLSLKDNIIYIKIKTNSLNNIQIMNKLAKTDNNIHNITFNSKNNEKYIINFEYGKKLKHRGRKRK